MSKPLDTENTVYPSLYIDLQKAKLEKNTSEIAGEPEDLNGKKSSQDQLGPLKDRPAFKQGDFTLPGINSMIADIIKVKNKAGDERKNTDQKAKLDKEWGAKSASTDADKISAPLSQEQEEAKLDPITKLKTLAEVKVGDSVARILNANDVHGDTDGKAGADADNRDGLEAVSGMLDGQLNSKNNTFINYKTKDADGKEIEGIAFKHQSDTHGTIKGFVSKADLDSGKFLGGANWQSIKDESELSKLLDASHKKRKADIAAHGGYENYKMTQGLRGSIVEMKAHLEAQDPSYSNPIIEKLNTVIDDLNKLKLGQDEDLKAEDIKKNFDDLLKNNAETHLSMLNARVAELKEKDLITDDTQFLKDIEEFRGDFNKLLGVTEKLDILVDKARNAKQAFKAGEEANFEQDRKNTTNLLAKLSKLNLTESDKAIYQKAQNLAEHIKRAAAKGTDARGQYLLGKQAKLNKMLADLKVKNIKASEELEGPKAPSETTEAGADLKLKNNPKAENTVDDEIKLSLPKTTPDALEKAIDNDLKAADREVQKMLSRLINMRAEAKEKEKFAQGLEVNGSKYHLIGEQVFRDVKNGKGGVDGIVNRISDGKIFRLAEKGPIEMTEAEIKKLKESK